MNNTSEIYRKFKDDNGEEIYCPIGADNENRHASGGDMDDCVEATTVGRYSGNLTVIERFTA